MLYYIYFWASRFEKDTVYVEESYSTPTPNYSPLAINLGVDCVYVMYNIYELEISTLIIKHIVAHR